MTSMETTNERKNIEIERTESPLAKYLEGRNQPIKQ